MTRLILINGAPGSGKSTLARMLVDEQPLALLLDIDTLRGQLGQWSDDPVAAGMAARRLALAMIHTHLVAGHDVVVPQFLFRLPFILELEQAPGAQPIEELYAVMLNMLRERPATLFVDSVPGDISGTFTALQQVIP